MPETGGKVIDYRASTLDCRAVILTAIRTRIDALLTTMDMDALVARLTSVGLTTADTIRVISDTFEPRDMPLFVVMEGAQSPQYLLGDQGTGDDDTDWGAEEENLDDELEVLSTPIPGRTEDHRGHWFGHEAVLYDGVWSVDLIAGNADLRDVLVVVGKAVVQSPWFRKQLHAAGIINASVSARGDYALNQEVAEGPIWMFGYSWTIKGTYEVKDTLIHMPITTVEFTPTATVHGDSTSLEEETSS